MQNTAIVSRLQKERKKLLLTGRVCLDGAGTFADHGARALRDGNSHASPSLVF